MEIEDKNNLNTAMEMVLDEEKMVTYVSLSKELCVHVNTGKKILYTLVDKIHKENTKIMLNITYLVSGITSENKAWTTVCSVNELEKIKENFSTIFYEHIYSVNKGNSCIDRNAFVLLNKFSDFNLCSGLIKGKECSIRTSEEIGNLKTNSQEFVTSSNGPLITPKKIKQEPNQSKQSQVKHKETKNNVKDEEKVEIKIKSESLSPKKGNSINKKTNTNLHSQKNQKGIAGFFNKSNGTTKRIMKEPNLSVNKNEERQIVKEEKMDVEEDSKAETNVSFEGQSKSDVNLKFKNDAHKQKKVLNQIKKTSKVDKKRKRVLHVSDSDSDAENDPFVDSKKIDPESDDEIPPTPSNNCIKITSGIVNPKKRRKVVDKTYTDEDGYILTKKEEIYESCSENEQDTVTEVIKDVTEVLKDVKEEKKVISPKESKPGLKNSKKKVSPPQKGKQSTLTSFFKKM